MAEELPSGDKAVYIFIEMIALGFVLYAIEEAFKDRPSWPKVVVALVLGSVFFLLGIKWPTIKKKTWGGFTVRIERVAGDYRYRYGLALLLVGCGAAYIMFSLRSIREDLELYVIPRAVTQEQRAKLVEYLSMRPPHAVKVRAVRHDPEAMEYAAQLFNAMRDTNWDINPPNHDGPGYFTIFRHIKQPQLKDLTDAGHLVYKSDIEFFVAYDAWLTMEMENRIGEELWGAEGLCIDIEMNGQPHNPDPRNPDSAQVLREAFYYAGIANCGSSRPDTGHDLTFLTIGHRPRQLRQPNNMPMRFKIAKWLAR